MCRVLWLIANWRNRHLTAALEFGSGFERHRARSDVHADSPM